MGIRKRISNWIHRIRIHDLNIKLKIKTAAFLIFLEKIKQQMIFLIKMSLILKDRMEVPNLIMRHL